MAVSDSTALLVVIESHIPTTEIIIRTLKRLTSFSEIKVVTGMTFNYKEFFSGKYKILFIRTCDPEWELLLLFLKKYKIKFAYYIDDNFWELKGKTPIAKYFQHKKVRSTLNYFVRTAEKVIAGSENLADYIRKRYNAAAVSIPAAFDFAILEGRTQLLKTPPIKIVYSGTLYRENDFKPVLTALTKLSNEYQNRIAIYFNGYVPNEMKQLANVFYDETFHNYDDFIRKMHEAHYDIGLAPLADTVSNRAKSNVKYREYGACLIAGVYSDLEPYQHCIKQERGLLVRHDQESWYKAIKSLIDNKELRENIIANAYADVRKNYCHDKIANKWQAIFDNLKKCKGHGVFLKWQILHFSYQILHFSYKVFYRGLRLPIRIKEYYLYHGFKNTLKKVRANLVIVFKSYLVRRF